MMMSMYRFVFYLKSKLNKYNLFIDVISICIENLSYTMKIINWDVKNFYMITHITGKILLLCQLYNN